MESLSLPLPLLYLLLIILAACLYCTLASSYQRTADEEQHRKSCEAQAAEQARSYWAQLSALQAKHDSEVRAHRSLRLEKSVLKDRNQELTSRCVRHERDYQYLSRANNTLREDLRAEKETTSAVEKAQSIQNQWDSVSDILEKAGFVANNPKDLASTIEKLQELRDSAEASHNQAALDKEELASEKAAKEAAQALNKQKDAVIQIAREQEELEATLKQQFTTLSSDLENAREVIAKGGPQVDALSKDLGNAHEEIAKRDQRVDALSKDLGSAHQEITKRGQQVDALSQDLRSAISKHDQQATALSNARKEVIDRDQEVARLSGELRNTQQESLKRDQEVTRLSDELAAVQQEGLKHAHEVTRLSSELAAKQLEVANNWTLIDSLSFNANTNNETYDSANNMANGSVDDPLVSLLAATSLGYDGTNQNPSFDYSTPGAQAGTNFTFDGDGFNGSINNGGSDNMMNFTDPSAYGGSNNDGGSADFTASSAPNDMSGLNNNNGGVTDTMDFSNFLQDLSELPVHEGWTDNGDFSNFGNSTDSNALGGYSGSDNVNGDLSNLADSSAPGGFSDLHNYNGDFSMFPDSSAPKDISGSGNPAELNPPGPPASTLDAFIPPLPPIGEFTFAPQGQVPTMADHQPLKTDEVDEIVLASEGGVDGVNAQELFDVMNDHEHRPRSDDDNGIDIRELPPVVQRSMFKYIRAQRKMKELKKPQGSQQDNGEMEE